MRKIIAFNRVSADGYFSDRDGGLNWATPDDELDRSAAANIPGTDTILFGRRTYQMFESFWPHAGSHDQTIATDPHDRRRQSAEIQLMADFINQATKIVFSKTIKKVTWTNSQLRSTFEAQSVADLKRQPGKDIMIFGSGSVVAQLTAHGLIDEYRFVVCPVFLGAGHNLLKEVSAQRALLLIESRAYPSGNVVLSYKPRT